MGISRRHCKRSLREDLPWGKIYTQDFTRARANLKRGFTESYFQFIGFLGGVRVDFGKEINPL
jgi:hypothetical protein